ncbi:hypothetical protein C8R45DRAFT_1101496 [Mycena sanguinolenta]|nr:hypothetical protein C8R45DRAFT_1101496 [Mycena sanguinolenta]
MPIFGMVVMHCAAKEEMPTSDISGSAIDTATQPLPRSCHSPVFVRSLSLVSFGLQVAILLRYESERTPIPSEREQTDNDAADNDNDARSEASVCTSSRVRLTGQTQEGKLAECVSFQAPFQALFHFHWILPYSDSFRGLSLDRRRDAISTQQDVVQTSRGGAEYWYELLQLDEGDKARTYPVSSRFVSLSCPSLSPSWPLNA